MVHELMFTISDMNKYKLYTSLLLLKITLLLLIKNYVILVLRHLRVLTIHAWN